MIVTFILISIHAAREGGDQMHESRTISERISIHAAREGGDARAQGKPPASGAFQSTPPVKAATKTQKYHHR